jgi:hypothetical protein
MAFSFSDQFFGTKTMSDAKRCRCQYHSNLLGWDVWVSTVWNREDEGLGSERYEVRATADAPECQADHGGATFDRTITRAQWENAAPNVNWDFFPTI